MSIANVENADGATRLLAQTTLRNMLGTKSLSEVLTDREYISSGMQVCTDAAVVVVVTFRPSIFDFFFFERR